MGLRSILFLDADLPSLFRQLGKPREGMFPVTTTTIMTDDDDPSSSDSPPNSNSNTKKSKLWLENDEARKLLPLGPPLYEIDSLTDRSERFFTSEIIRGSIFVNLGKEVPYCCEVRIQEFKEPTPKDPTTRIKADIVVERDSQLGIVVGKSGSMIKAIGTDARKKIDEFLNQDKIFLELNVKVDKNWRKSEDRLVEYGYLKPKKK